MRATGGPAARARALLEGVRGAHLNDDDLLARASELASLLLQEARKRERYKDRKRAHTLTQLMADPAGHVFSTLLADRAYRSGDPGVAVDAARQLLRRLGIPAYLPPVARVQLKALLRLGPFMPELAATEMFKKLRSETRDVVLPAEEPMLSRYLAQRHAQGVRVNLNQLGEAVLGEREAETRMQEYLALLARPDVDAISVKASSVLSQVDVVAWESTLATLVERLRVLYRQALAHRFRDARGEERPKLVNLDMEAYRDLELTVTAFREVLDEDELRPLTAGIALQAYLPDSARVQRELTQWAIARRARGGAPIRVRLVKGANLLAERAESSLRGWEVPIFASKAEVDASYKKMLEHGCEPAHAAAVQLGVASHNVFDLALGLVLRASRGVEAQVSFELLEGMANPLCEALRELAGSVLVYAPVVRERNMQTAIAYLMRRLDESTAE
jgi:RHH-type proline utilization regulon transcriptional repressor/proline dehydrogenase/delta 1-pyrroline-5-carboxylate dehydrogenase